MNCKPGDLAIISRDTNPTACTENLIGRLCTVLEAAPRHIFQLPDGRLSTGGTGKWVVELQHEAVFIANDGCQATSAFTCIDDWKLRPIRPSDESADTVRELYSTKPSEVAA